MPDFTLESFWLCETARSWECQVGTHTVRWGFCYGGPVQYDYVCDNECKGFKFRKHCRHVDEAKKLHCNWQQFTDGGKPTKDKRCPKCGGPITAERYAV